MKNNLVIIMCHCNDDIKKKTLNKNIDKIKSEGFDIFVLSHMPVSNSIQNKIDYFIYDKSNPTITYPYRGMVFWRNLKFKDKKIKLQNILDDYGWTAFNQILLGGNLGVSLGYEYFSFINYDVKLTDNIIHDLNNPVPFLVSKVKDLRLKDIDYRFPSFMLNILSKENLKSILPIINKKYYMSDQHPWKEEGKFKDAEEYWGNLIQNFEYSTHIEPIVDQISFEDTDGLFYFSNNKNFKIFFQNSNTHKRIHTEDWIPRVIIYDNNTPELTLVVNSLETIIEGSNVCLELPNEITKIGYILKGKYIDLTKKYYKSIFSTIDLE
jgi:hypothetical protein